MLALSLGEAPALALREELALELAPLLLAVAAAGVALVLGEALALGEAMMLALSCALRETLLLPEVEALPLGAPLLALAPGVLLAALPLVVGTAFVALAALLRLTRALLLAEAVALALLVWLWATLLGVSWDEELEFPEAKGVCELTLVGRSLDVALKQDRALVVTRNEGVDGKLSIEEGVALLTAVAAALPVPPGTLLGEPRTPVSLALVDCEMLSMEEAL
jgi:hypothetical protein